MEDSNAAFPTKANPNDVGYDITIIKKEKDISDSIAMYDTGVRILPSDYDDMFSNIPNLNGRYYVEILPRSSLSKSGYILANSVGVIDPEYQGTLKVVLIKVDDSLPDIQLPFKGFQLVVRRNFQNASFLSFQEPKMRQASSRGVGGFGSTDSREYAAPAAMRRF